MYISIHTRWDILPIATKRVEEGCIHIWYSASEMLQVRHVYEKQNRNLLNRNILSLSVVRPCSLSYSFKTAALNFCSKNKQTNKQNKNKTKKLATYPELQAVLLHHSFACTYPKITEVNINSNSFGFPMKYGNIL